MIKIYPMVEEVILSKLLKLKLASLGVDLDGSPWTVYAAIFAYDRIKLEYELISLGSGVKCLPDYVLADRQECLVHDLHAEVVCRRSFISFIYSQLIAINNNSDLKVNKYLLFDETLNKHYWNPDLELMFYTSQSPCKKITIYFGLYLYRW